MEVHGAKTVLLDRRTNLGQFGESRCFLDHVDGHVPQPLCVVAVSERLVVLGVGRLVPLGKVEPAGAVPGRRHAHVVADVAGVVGLELEASLVRLRGRPRRRRLLGAEHRADRRRRCTRHIYSP